MGIKDYLNFGRGKELEVDYIVRFKNERPCIDQYPDLKRLGNWRTYGEKCYRLWCKLSKEDFEQQISEVLKIAKDEFTVIRPAEFAGARFL